MGVDLDGFHSPFNHGACNKAPEEQAKYIKKVVRRHKLCAKNTPQGRAAMFEYWEEHAGPIIVERQLLEWKCDTFKSRGRKQPSDTEIAEKQAALEQELVVPKPPVKCQDRMRAMHKAIAQKLPEMLAEIVATGEVTAAQALSGAPQHQLPVEDIFRFTRGEHDQSCVQLIGIIAAKRRILKAPRRGTKNGLPHRFTLERPPPFYHPWLRQCLRKRARARMREEWPSMLARAMMRWEAVCQAAEIADEQVEVSTERAATALAKVKELPGGDVLLDDEVAPLPAGTLLTLDMFRNIKFEERTDRRGGGTGWTLDAVKNQLRLWNLRRPEWSELEVDMFSKAGLIEPGKAFNLSGTRAVLVKRLRLILTTQRAAERRQAVLDTAMRRLDQEQEEERVAQEQADSVAERQSRRGRGENAWRTRG